MWVARASGLLVPDYDATGGGNTGSGVSSRTLSHIGAAGATALLAVGWDQSSSVTTTVTYNGAPMNPLVSALDNNSSAFGGVIIFGLLGCVTGDYDTINVSFSAAVSAALCVPVSYAGVTSFGTTNTAYGASQNLSQTFTSPGGKMVFQAFSSVAGTTSFTLVSYNQTQRYNGHVVGRYGTNLIAGDAPSASSVSFTAANSAVGAPGWSAAAVALS